MAKKVKLLPESTVKISNGPSKFDVMLSIFEAKRITITLFPQKRTEELFEVEVVFSLIGQEDGINPIWTGCLTVIGTGEKRSFCYDSSRRTGTIHPKNEGWRFSVKNENY